MKAMSIEIPLNVVPFDKEDEHIRHIPSNSKLFDICAAKLDANTLTIIWGKRDFFYWGLSLFDIENNVIYYYQDYIKTTEVGLLIPQSVIERSISLTITVDGITYGGYIN